MSLAPDHRTRELAKIHILAEQLGMDTRDDNPDSEYRAMLWSIGRERSAARLDFAGRRRVLDHLSRLAASRDPHLGKPGADLSKRNAHVATHGKKPVVSEERQPYINKLEALLADGGKSWNYVRSMAKRICKVDALEFADEAKLRKLVAALEIDKRRRKSKQELKR